MACLGGMGPYAVRWSAPHPNVNYEFGRLTSANCTWLHLTTHTSLRLGVTPKPNLLIHESPLTDALFLLVSKSDEVTTT